MWGLGRTILILLAIGVAGVAAWQSAIRWHPSIERYPVQGVDVSERDGTIDWNAAAAAGADFGYAVATRGATGRDRAFEANWQAIEAAGLRRGAVHVYSLCQPAIAQANAFNTVVPRDAGALPAAVDLNEDDGCAARPDRAALIGDIARFATIVEAHMGKPMLLRIARPIEARYRLSEALPRNIWAMGNFLSPRYAARPWRMWRASDIRRIDGVEGPVNWDVAAE